MQAQGLRAQGSLTDTWWRTWPVRAQPDAPAQSSPGLGPVTFSVGGSWGRDGPSLVTLGSWGGGDTWSLRATPAPSVPGQGERRAPVGGSRSGLHPPGLPGFALHPSTQQGAPHARACARGHSPCCRASSQGHPRQRFPRRCLAKGFGRASVLLLIWLTSSSEVCPKIKCGSSFLGSQGGRGRGANG